MRDTYFTDIENAFCTRRGKHGFVGPTDWQLMEEWKERGVPLHVVLNAIDNVFKNRKDNSRKVNSISYCKDEVEALFKEWRDSQVGKHDSAEATEPEEDYTTATAAKLTQRMNQLESIKDAPPAKLSSEIAFVVPLLFAEIQEFHIHKDPQKLEENLTYFENRLRDALFESVPTTEGVKLLLEAEKELSPYRSQIGEDYHQQLRELHLKKLRERFGVPRLSLFYL